MILQDEFENHAQSRRSFCAAFLSKENGFSLKGKKVNTYKKTFSQSGSWEKEGMEKNLKHLLQKKRIAMKILFTHNLYGHILRV